VYVTVAASDIFMLEIVAVDADRARSGYRGAGRSQERCGRKATPDPLAGMMKGG
jgi:hypothetical protein